MAGIILFSSIFIHLPFNTFQAVVVKDASIMEARHSCGGVVTLRSAKPLGCHLVAHVRLEGNAVPVENAAGITEICRSLAAENRRQEVSFVAPRVSWASPLYKMYPDALRSAKLPRLPAWFLSPPPRTPGEVRV
jgi:hypothetical protein